MSYDIRLVDQSGEVVQFNEPHQLKGGTYAAGGTRKAWLNITYNYSGHFCRVFGANGIRTLYGMTAAASLPILREAVAKLGGDVSDNYWDSTEGNARKALEDLITLAEMAPPESLWEGD